MLCPLLKFGNSYTNTKEKVEEVVTAIIYKLQTGCQWSRHGSCKRVWTTLLEQHKHLLDMSRIQLDGSCTSAIRGG